MSFTFQNNQSGNGGFITMHLDNEEIGRLTYTIMPQDQKLIISFVNIYPKFEGNGYGKHLVQDAINFARKNNWKVYPHCSYARTVMSRMTDVKDILLLS